MTVNYRDYQMARNKANKAMEEANAKFGFYKTVELEIYTVDGDEKVATTVRVHENGLDASKIDDVAALLWVAKQMMADFPYNGYTVTYED